MHIQYKDRSVMRFYSRKRDVIIDSPQRYVEMIDAEHTIVQIAFCHLSMVKRMEVKQN